MDKDESLDRLLQRTARARVGPRARRMRRMRRMDEACLEPEAIAAWMDGTLTAHEREAAEAHAAECDRCLSVLAAVARTSPPPSVAESPRWFPMRWALPLATAAVAITAWVLVPGSQAPSPAPPPVAQERAASSPAPPADDQVKPAEQPAPVPRADASAKPLTEETLKRSAEVQARPAARDQAAAKPAPSQPPPADAKESRDSLADAPSNRARFEAREAVSSPAQPAAGLPATAAPAPAPAPPLPQTAPPPSAPAAVARSAPTQAPMLPRPEADGRNVAMRVTARPVVDIQSPDGNVRWRLDGATVSRTSNGGATWSEQFTGTATTLTAGFSPSPTICWVVGRRGVVLLSTDSQTWRRLEFPGPAADLVRVTATDSNAATVHTLDGRVFRTADGGRTWTAQEKLPAPF